jgi:hypothetical protein
MSRILLPLLVLLLAASARAQGFFDQKPAMWWPAVRFNAEGTELRGIPVQRIRADWCKATEFTRELFADDLTDAQGRNGLDEAGLAFALEGGFDGTGTPQIALVGIYETCRGRKGGFVLIIDRDTRKVRFLQAEDALKPFAALRREGDGAIRVAGCLRCGISSVVRWDQKRRRFVMR